MQRHVVDAELMVGIDVEGLECLSMENISIAGKLRRMLEIMLLPSKERLQRFLDINRGQSMLSIRVFEHIEHKNTIIT